MKNTTEIPQNSSDTPLLAQNVGGQNPLDGINCSTDQMLNGSCTVNVDKILGVRENSQQNSPSDLIQDLVLGATFFIGTVLTVVVVRAGFSGSRAASPATNPSNPQPKNDSKAPSSDSSSSPAATPSFASSSSSRAAANFLSSKNSRKI